MSLRVAEPQRRSRPASGNRRTASRAPREEVEVHGNASADAPANVLEPGATPSAGSIAPLNRGQVATPESRRQPPAAPQPPSPDDSQRLVQTTRLLHEIAPAFGLAPERIDLRWDDEAAQATESRHALGLMDRGRVLLHPSHYQPATPGGRYLLAHELAHLAQRQETRLVPGTAIPDAVAAEHEADALGRAFANHAPLTRPRAVLPLGAVAARSSQEHPTSPPTATQQLIDAARSVHTSEISAIRSLLHTGLFDWWVSDGEVTKILTILSAFSWVTSRALIGALADKERWKLADNISSSHWKNFRPQILAAYAALSAKDVARLSRGNFQGMSFLGFTDEEHFALREILGDRPRLHQIVGSLATSPVAREAWEELRTAEIQYDEASELKNALRTTAALEQTRKDREARVTKDDLAPRLRRWLKILRGWWITDAEALRVLDEIGGYLREPGAVEAIGQALERSGLLDDLIRNIPASRLYERPLADAGVSRPPDRRKVLLRLASVRPPHKNIDLAKRFLAYRLWDWAITGDEAYLAFQLVKVLPSGSQTAFFNLEDGKFALRLHAQMSQSMREGETMNFFTGGQDQRELKSIQVQLLDDAVWNPRRGSGTPRFGRLESLLRMAVAAGEHEWLFEQSRRRHPQFTAAGLDRDPEFRERIIEKFRLYRSHGVDDEGKTYVRERYDPESLKGVPFADEVFEVITNFPILGKAVDALSFFARVLDFLWSCDTARVFGSLFTQSIGGKHIDLADMQELLDGNLFGVRLKPAVRRGRKKGKRAGEQVGTPDINYASARWDFARGLLEAEVEELRIAAIHYPLESMKFQTGEGTATGLRVKIGYPTQTNHQSPFLDLTLRSLSISDILITYPDLMQNVNSAEASDLVLRMGARSTNFSQLPKASRGLDLGAFLILPIIGKFVSLPVLSRGKPTLAEAGWQMHDGLLEPRLPMDLTVSAGRTVLHGLAKSGGQYIDSIEVSDLTIRGGESLASYREALEKSLHDYDARIAAVDANAHREAPDQVMVRRDRLQRLRAVIAKEYETAVANEAELTVLRSKQEKDLTPRDKARLRELRGGVLLDIGSIHIRGLEGLVNLGELHLTDVHGHGTSLAGALSLLTPNETLARLFKGEQYHPAILGRHRDPSTFSLDLGTFQTGPLSVRDALPTVADLDEDLAQLNKRIELDPRDPALLAQRLRLQERRKLVVQYENLVNRGIENLNTGQERDVVRLREELLRGSGFEIQRIAAQDATVSLGPIGMRTPPGGNGSETLDTTGIQRAGFTARHFDVQGLRVPESGIAVETIQGDEVSIDYDRATQGGRLRVRGTKLAIEGVTRSTSRDLLTQERDVLMEQVRLRSPVALFLASDRIQTLLEEAVPIQRDLARTRLAQFLATFAGELDPSIDTRLRAIDARLEQWKQRAGYVDLQREHARLGQDIARQHLAQSEGRIIPGLDESIRALEARLKPLESWWRSLDPAKIDLSREILGLQIALPARRRIEEIDTWLSELSQLEARLETAEHRLQRARARRESTREAEEDILAYRAELERWAKRIVIGQVVAEDVRLSVSGLGNIFADDFDMASRFRQGLTIEADGDRDDEDLARTPWARRLELKDARLPGLQAGRVEVTNLRGRFTSSATQIHFEGIGFDGLLLERFAAIAFPHHVFSEGASRVSGVELNGEIRMATRTNAIGEQEWAPAGVHIAKLAIGRLEADRLGYTNSENQLFVEVLSGAIGGIELRDSEVDLATSPTPRLRAHAVIGQVEQLQLLAYLSDTLRGQGTLDGHGLSVDYLDDGEKRLLTTRVEELSLSGGDLTYGSNRIRGYFKKMSGGATLDPAGTLLLQDIRIDQVHLGPSHFSTPGVQTYIDSGADIRQLRLDARVEFEHLPTQTRLKRIQVTQLRFDSGSLEGVRVRLAGRKEDPAHKIEAEDPVAIDLNRADAEGFFLRGDNLIDRRFAVDVQRKFEVKGLKVKVGEVGKETLKAGLSVKGSAIGGRLYGPDRTVIDLGTITMLNGTFEGHGLETGINTWRDFKLTGGVTIGSNYVMLQDLDTEGSITSWKTKFNDSKGTTLDLNQADLHKIHLQDLKFSFGTVTEDGKEVRRLTAIHANQLSFERISSLGMVYTGDTRSTGPAGIGTAPLTTTKSRVEATSTLLTNVRLRELDLDLIRPFQKFDIAGIRMASVRGLKASIVKTLGSRETMAEFLGNVWASGIEANLTFDTVKLAPDRDWSRVQGTFHLTEFGLDEPVIKTRDAEGKEFKIRGLQEAEPGVRLKGVNATFHENGTLLVGADEVSAKDLEVIAGETSFTIPTVKITSALAGLRGYGLQEGIEFIGATARELSADHLRVTVSVDRTPSDKPSTDPTPATPFTVEPAGGLSGTAFYEYRAMPSWLVLGHLDIDKGGIEITDVPVPAVKYGGDSSGYGFSGGLEGVFERGVSYFSTGLSAIVLKYLQHEAASITKGTTMTRLDLRKLLEKKLSTEASTGGTPNPQKKEAKDLTDLWKLKLDINRLVLGEGLIGTKDQFTRLTHDKPDTNIFSVHSPLVVGAELNVNSPRVHSSQTYLDFGGRHAGIRRPVPPVPTVDPAISKLLKTDDTELVNVRIELTNLATTVFTATLRVQNSKITNIRFGNVQVLDNATLGSLAPPTESP